MRERVKMLALDLLIQHGYRGVSFGILAKLLDTTRANIHYHFGNKESLVEEVLEDYVDATLVALKGIWTAPEKTFTSKIDAMVDYGTTLNLGQDEWLTVAARDNGDGIIPGDLNEMVTITLRLRGRDLADVKAGRLSRDEARQRVEVRAF